MERRTFTYAEAVALLPEVRHLTELAYGRVESLAPGAGTPETAAQIESIVSEWTRAMAERGIEVKGPWLIDFDSGSGYYCWRHPEQGLLHFHTYEAGFSGRVPIQ